MKIFSANLKQKYMKNDILTFSYYTYPFESAFWDKVGELESMKFVHLKDKSFAYRKLP